MISALGPTVIRSPYLNPGSQLAPPVPSAPPSIVDTVSVCAPPSAGRTWRALGVATLLAVPILAGALVAAHADQLQPPPSPCVVSQAEIQVIPADRPVSRRALRQMEEQGKPAEVDNATAQRVREGYGRAAKVARQHSESFARDAARLRQQGSTLEEFATRDAGIYGEGNCTVTISRNETATVVRTDGADGSATLQLRDGMRMVTVRESDQTMTLQETDTQRQVLTENVSRTLHLKDSANHKAGDFEVIVREGRPGGLPGGVRRSEHIVVRGASLTDEVRQTISGFVGNIDVHRVDRFETPQATIQVYPQVRVRETYTSKLDDALTGQQTVTSRVVEVRQDGSSRIRQTIDGEVEERVEPPAVLVRGGR